MEDNFSVSRRNFFGSTSILAVGLLLAPKMVFAREENLFLNALQETLYQATMREAATAKITPIKLRGNITVLEGSGGNISVLDGPEGLLMVDAGIGVSKVNVSAAIKNVSNRPLKYLINTHWHFDHADGNLWLKKQDMGAVIIGQENTLKHLSKDTEVPEWGYTFPAVPTEARPTRIFKDTDSLTFNGEKIQLKHYGPAHTDGDISVYFPMADILVAADTYWNGYYPFIDYGTGGNIDGLILAAKKNVKMVSDKTIVVPGHGPIGNKQQLIVFRDMLIDIRGKVASLKKQGKTLEQTIAARPTAAYDSKWGGFMVNGELFTTLVYRGIS